MAKWQPRIRRHDGQVRYNRPDGRTVDLPPHRARLAAEQIRDSVNVATRNGGTALDVGPLVPGLGGRVALTTDLALLLAVNLWTCSATIEAQWCQGVVDGEHSEHVHVEVGAGAVCRWAGDPGDYPPPSAGDLADADG